LPKKILAVVTIMEIMDIPRIIDVSIIESPPCPLFPIRIKPRLRNLLEGEFVSNPLPRLYMDLCVIMEFAFLRIIYPDSKQTNPFLTGKRPAVWM
jgi:hypothetical protein